MPEAREVRRCRVLGLPVSVTSMDHAVAVCVSAVESGRTFRVAVTNANKSWLAFRDPALRDFMESAELVLPESATVWGARRLGHRDVRPGWGVALMERLLDQADVHGWSVYLVGARPEVLDALVSLMGGRWPRVRVVGSHHGFLDNESEARLLENVAESAADLLLVGMGSPRQERFIASLPVDRGPSVRLGVGGSFDVHAGVRKDAPPWIRGSGFEWLYRALLSPRLFRRYLVVNPWFAFHILRERWTGRTPRLLP